MPNEPGKAGGAVKTFKIGRNPKTLVEVSIYRTGKGRYMASFYDVSGKRIRPERATLNAAEQAARDYIGKHISTEALERDFLDSKAAKIVVPSNLIAACHEYSDAQKLLFPYQVSLLDAVRFYVAKTRETQRSVTAAYAVDDFLAKVKGRKKTEKVNRVYLTRIKKDWAELKITDVDHVYINKWIAGLEGSERTKRNYFDGASLLFRYAKDNGWFPLERQSPNELANRPEAESPQIEIFTPEEGSALLSTAKDLESPAYPVIAIVGWSGCRTEEIAPEFSDKGRLEWENLLWADRFPEAEDEDRPTEDQIHVTPEAAKRTRKKDLRRYIPLLSNLATLLSPLRNKRGPIYSPDLPPIAKEFARVAKKAGVLWKRNALRHSYGTYRVAVTKNVPTVAFEMGNTVEMVQRHYSRPTPPHVARRWFKIVT